MDEKKIETNTGDVVVTNPVTSAVQENKPVEAVAVQNNPAPVQPVQVEQPQVPVVETLEVAQTPVVETPQVQAVVEPTVVSPAVVEAPQVQPEPVPVAPAVVETVQPEPAPVAPAVVETVQPEPAPVVVQPEPTPVQTQTVASPVIGPAEEKVEEVEVKSESEEMIDKNKKIISSSPQMVDSSTIDVNAGINTTASETNVVSETVIETDINQQVLEQSQKETTFEEVSLSVESNALELTEAENDPNSIFNRVDPKQTKEDAPAKIGEEKHKFPFFMVFVFILMIVAAFNMEAIGKFVKEYIDKTPAEEEEEQTKKDPNEQQSPYILDKPVEISALKEKLDNSKIISNFEAEHNIEVTIDYDEVNKKLSFATSNYLNLEEQDSIVSEYEIEEEKIKTEFDSSTEEFDLMIIKAIIIALGDIENLQIDNYEAKVSDIVDNLASDNNKNHIWSITSQISNLDDGFHTYIISISLTYQSIIV